MRLHHLLLLGALAPGTALAVPAYTVTDLGTLGGDTSSGQGINDRGQVTGHSYPAGSFNFHAFVWDPAARMLDLNDLVAPGSGWVLEQRLAINDAGQINRFRHHRRPDACLPADAGDGGRGSGTGDAGAD